MDDSRDAEIGLLTDEIKSSIPSRQQTNTYMRRNAALSLFIFMGLLALIFVILHQDTIHDIAYLERTEDLPINILVVGDWGRRGKYNQSLVATQMGNVGRELNVDFIISTGDNFYDSGLEAVDDHLFEESFTQVYQAQSLQKPWFAVLGNHDYRGNPQVQVNSNLKLRDPRWHCDYMYTLPVDLNSGNGVLKPSYAEFFFIDTNPLEEDYWTPDNDQYNWTRSTPREVVIADQVKTLTSALEASTATWKLVIGHHTLFSYGPHGNTPELIEKVLPILNANKVDMYVNGHDHCLQHIKRSDSSVHFVTSGGGSKAWKGQIPPANLEDSKLYYDGQGFISISVSASLLNVNYYDVSGKVIHRIRLKK